VHPPSKEGSTCTGHGSSRPTTGTTGHCLPLKLANVSKPWLGLVLPPVHGQTEAFLDQDGWVAQRRTSGTLFGVLSISTVSIVGMFICPVLQSRARGLQESDQVDQTVEFANCDPPRSPRTTPTYRPTSALTVGCWCNSPKWPLVPFPRHDSARQPDDTLPTHRHRCTTQTAS
jgi:hypothetical protein